MTRQNTENSLLTEAAVIADSKTRRRITIGGITVMLFALTSIIVDQETRKKPMGLSTDTPASNTSAPSTLAPKRANTSAPSTLAPAVSPTDSVDFVTSITGIGLPDITQSCTGILQGNSNITLSGLVLALLSGLRGGPSSAELKADACSNPAAQVPCGVPGMNVVVDCSDNSSSSGSGSSGNCYNPFQLSSLMNPANKLLKKIKADCEQDAKGNSTATCGENGKGRTIFSSSKFFPSLNATVNTTGFFVCSNGANRIPSRNAMKLANKGMQRSYR